MVWDLRTLSQLWKQPGDAYHMEFSPDGTRLFTHRNASNSNGDILAFHARTGDRIATLFGNEIVWMNHEGTRAITYDSGLLQHWDVDTQMVLAALGIGPVDEKEEKADKAALEGSPEAVRLIEIAKRRLRSCEAPK